MRQHGNQSLRTALPWSLFAWLIQSVGLIIIVRILGFSDSDPLLIMGIYNISLLAGALSFIPGGIGATEAVISLLFAKIGMDMNLAILAAIIVRGMTLWLAVFLGVISMLLYSTKGANERCDFL